MAGKCLPRDLLAFLLVVDLLAAEDGTEDLHARLPARAHPLRDMVLHLPQHTGEVEGATGRAESVRGAPAYRWHCRRARGSSSHPT